ncbi:uncharacterized protein TRUGW13939_04619 [Talaromyces rugulosus]|uniref:Uncharacterized protein n=1 Tax=Talaromyces rugulosus TaxID=121627 RepID=A0A7H8QVI8_TALRU|nr:uncharacterized protein TRUGW13939_04619 [Talaromyces rugulosus]QKX57505.1 hypothetical protein TRUGW13939_04619 [Talaromyces rugulosus]
MAFDSAAGAYRKKLPPTPVGSSLEGLEIGIPPVQFTNPWLSKPLPKIPDRTSTIYSKESIINSYLNRPDTNDDTRTKHTKNGSTSHPRRFGRKRNATANRNSMSRMSDQANRCSLTLRTFLSEEQYGVGMHLAKANHYFREKKWEIFPELGPQPVIQHGQQNRNQNLKRKRILGGSHIRQISNCDNFNFNLRPIADYMQQTLAKKASQLRLKKKPSKADFATTTRPRHNSSSSNESEFLSIAEDIGNTETQRSIAAVRRRMREMSLWSRADSSEETLRYDYNEFAYPVTATSSTWRSPASGFNTSSSTTLNSRVEDRPMHYYDMPPSAKNLPPPPDKEYYSQPTPGSLPEYAKVLQQKTNHVLLVLDGAKKKFTEARAARRRKQLKKHIRIIGPIENYPYGSASEWV